MLLSGPQHKSQFWHFSLSLCVPSPCQRNTIVCGDSRIPEYTESNLQLMGTALRYFLRFFSVFLLPNSCSVEKTLCNHSCKIVSPFLGIINNFFHPWALLYLGLAFIGYVVIHEFLIGGLIVFLYYVSICVISFVSFYFYNVSALQCSMGVFYLN